MSWKMESVSIVILTWHAPVFNYPCLCHECVLLPPTQTVDGGTITMSADTKPTDVQVFHATTIQSKRWGTLGLGQNSEWWYSLLLHYCCTFSISCFRKDFRLLSLPAGSSSPIPQPVFWFSDSLQPDVSKAGLHNNSYTVRYKCQCFENEFYYYYYYCRLMEIM